MHRVLRGPLKGDKITIAMSGGVDSSVTAALLAYQDKYELEGIFMRNWDTADDDSMGGRGCRWERDWEDVRSTCKVLGIKARMVDLSKEYWTRVFEPSLGDWESGRTPNPDVWCNKEVKFGALLDRLTHPSFHPRTSKAPWLATGHYARKEYHPTNFGAREKDDKGRYLPRLLRHPSLKDQSYYLASIPLSSLERTIFPLGNPPGLPPMFSPSVSSSMPMSTPSSPSLPSASLPPTAPGSGNERPWDCEGLEGEPLTKQQIRTLAKRFGLHSALRREESMGICFVGEKRKFGEFVSQYIPTASGPIIHLPTGLTLGRHTGLWNYTIGQGARISGVKERLFVVRKGKGDGGEGVVWVAPGTHPSLYVRSLTTTNFTWIWAQPPSGLEIGAGSEDREGEMKGMKARVQVRHVGGDVEGWVYAHTPNTLKITFPTPQKAISPGQVVVIYDERGVWCLGCGVIERTECLG